MMGIFKLLVFDVFFKLGDIFSCTEINSKCGTGTIFDPETNSCITG